MAKRSQDPDRRERAAAILKQHRRAERRRTLLIVGGAAAIAALILGATVWSVVQQNQKTAATEAAAKQPIEGVEEFPGLSRNHVMTPVDYPQKPSVGGDHAPVWTNCGAYTVPVDASQATHSLEHGAVWIGYQPDLPSDQVDELAALTRANNFLLVSPVEGAPAPITLSAWGVQLQVDSVEDPRLATFVEKYQLGEQAPEPGAPCTGGAGGMS